MPCKSPYATTLLRMLMMTMMMVAMMISVMTILNISMLVISSSVTPPSTGPLDLFPCSLRAVALGAALAEVELAVGDLERVDVEHADDLLVRLVGGAADLADAAEQALGDPKRSAPRSPAFSSAAMRAASRWPADKARGRPCVDCAEAAHDCAKTRTPQSEWPLQ